MFCWCGMMCNQNCQFSKRSVGQGQVNDRFTLGSIQHPVVSGSVVISNYQPVLIYNFIPVCNFPQLCAPRVPAFAADIDLCCGHHAASLLPDHFLPVQFLCWSLSSLPSSLIVNVYNSYESLWAPVNLHINHSVTCVRIQVQSFICSMTGSLVCHISCFLMLYADWLIPIPALSICEFFQTLHIHSLFHPCLQCGHGLYVWPGAVVLDYSENWGQQLPFHCQGQCRSTHPSQLLSRFVLAFPLSVASRSPPFWYPLSPLPHFYASAITSSLPPLSPRSSTLALMPTSDLLATAVGPMNCMVRPAASLLLLFRSSLLASDFFAPLLLNVMCFPLQ